MASEEAELETTQRGRRGRRPSAGPVTDGSPGLLRLLWADLRKQQIYSEPDPVDLEEFEAEQEFKRSRAARTGPVHAIGADKLEQLRRRYWNGS